MKLSQKIKQILPDGNMPQWAIRWILDHPEVTTVIPGASKVSQVDSNIGASALEPMPADTHRQLRSLYDAEIIGKIRGHY